MTEFQTIPLRLVKRQRVAGAYDTQTLYLIVRDKIPVRLGSGRYAEVVVAASGDDIDNADKFYALKFLKQDRNSLTVSRNARKRFFEELDKTLHFSADQAHFVVYVGCSRIKDVPAFATQGGKREVSEAAFDRRVQPQLQQTAAENSREVAGKLSPEFLDEVQGDFFAMEAEEGTLEDLLFDARPWTGRTIFTVRRDLKKELENKIDQHRARVREFLDDIRNPEIIAGISRRDRADWSEVKRAVTAPASGSGFELLKYIGLHVPSVKNCIVLSLARELADKIRKIHTNTNDQGGGPPPEGWLAHRDLKPGNFLFSCAAGPRLRVSDLGFVGGLEVIRGGMNSMDDSVHEPGVLSPGSPLFRAPEQLPALEVRFEVVADGQPRIQFANIGGIAEAEVGDWFECQELGFRGAKAQVRRIEETDGRVVLTLSENVRLGRKASPNDTHVGYLVKSSGQHTDVFALGCMLYLLASIGRNPEKFFVKCLESVSPVGDSRQAASPVADQRQLAGLQFYRLLHEDCLSLALSLCVDRPDAIAEDLSRLLDPAQKAAQLSRIALIRPEAFRAMYDVGVVAKADLRAAHARSKSEHGAVDGVGLENYLNFLRGSPTTQTYLRDSNGVPLSMALVWEIVRCMVRDKPGSHVRRERPDEQSFFDVADCHKITGRIYARLGELLEKAPSCMPDLKRFHAMESGNPANMFFLIRACFQEATTTPPPTTGPGSSPPGGSTPGGRNGGGPDGPVGGGPSAGPRVTPQPPQPPRSSSPDPVLQPPTRPVAPAPKAPGSAVPVDRAGKGKPKGGDAAAAGT